MIAPDFMDELDCGFYDNIDDLLVDFAGDDVDAAGALAGAKPESSSFPSIWSTRSDSLPNSDSVFSGHSVSADLSAELSVPYEDIVQMEWLSIFVEDSFSGGESLTMNKEQQDSSSQTRDRHFQTLSPNSVLESSSSCSGGPPPQFTVENVSNSPPGSGGRRGRARSKRPRPASFSPRPATIHLIDSESFAESRPLIKLPKPVPVEPKKKKKIKLTFPLAAEAPAEAGGGPVAVRKCMHCEITKTPQWRAGPMGPKTLCNACGVRFKSGRLFPEYRPAASPTFVPALHSNSHKKVLEMRGKDFVIVGTSPELIPNADSSCSMGYV